GIVTVADKAPITFKMHLPEDLDNKLANPGLPRASIAPDADHPNGSEDAPRKDMSVLQQHIEFFDRSKSGTIYPWETYSGMRSLGFNMPFSALASVIINGSFSYPTSSSYIPSPFFPITVENIHRGKHGSDTGVYDTEGRFIPEKFEEIFSKFDVGNKGGLTFSEFYEMTVSMRVTQDFFGWFAAKFEWGTLYLLGQKDGIVPKEVIRRQYDGTLFYEIERKGQEKK
ncbi:caleosin, partial [Blyttiomyces helicus]